MSKLTYCSAEELIMLLKKHKTQRKIAQAYNVSNSWIVYLFKKKKLKVYQDFVTKVYIEN